MNAKQINLFDDIYIDSFAGGGGASTGIELATGRPVTVAINHDESAILMHRQNHPYTKHYREDVWSVDPKTATGGRHVRLAWFSPDCKHFSRAKGKALVDKKIRGLAWIVLKWAAIVRPDVIMLENVPEFVTWCPVRKGKPVKSKKGQTYSKWYSQLSNLGYHIETNVLCAADYGAPTIRKRFCLIARCDGSPIVWPERTHAPADSAEVKNGKCKPWRAAAEIIDWRQPCYSIFDSKEKIKKEYGARVQRPLKPNTLRRISKGLDKFVIKSAKPFIVECNHSDDRTHSLNRPLNTVTGKYSGGIVTPQLSPYIMCNNAQNVPHNVEEPLPTVTTANRNFYTEAKLSPYMIQYHSEQSGKEVRGQLMTEPIQTVDASNRYGLAAVHLTQYFSGEGHYHSVQEPLATVTTMEREGVASAFLSKYYGGVVGDNIEKPLPTVTAVDHNALCAAFLSEYYGEEKSGSRVDKPLRTVTAKDKHTLIEAKIVKYSEGYNLGYWSEIRALLNEYCGYNLNDDEVILLNISGIWYFISDIALRMLTPRELYDAMSFPHDYIIDVDPHGRPIKRADQVARCGNAVCPLLAKALVSANLPECSGTEYKSMEELHRTMVS